MAKNTDAGLRRKELKKFGLSFGLGMAILTSIGLWKSFPPAVILTSSVLSVFHISGSFLYPVVLSPTFKAVSVLGKMVSHLLTAVFFSFFYYIVFTPFAVLFRITGKDVIQKQLKSRGWIDIPESENDSSRIMKQF